MFNSAHLFLKVTHSRPDNHHEASRLVGDEYFGIHVNGMGYLWIIRFDRIQPAAHFPD
jgi:hypothetical protein